MNEDLQLQQLRQGSNKHQQKLKMFKRNIEKYITKDSNKQQHQSAVKPAQNLTKTSVNSVHNLHLNPLDVKTQKQFYKNLNIPDESFNKFSDSVSPKNVPNDFSYFNSTLFKNQSLFNQNKSNFNMPGTTTNQPAHKNTSNGWMEETSHYTQNSGIQDFKYPQVEQGARNSKQKQLLNDIDKLLSSIDNKKYGNNNAFSTQKYREPAAQVSAGSSRFSTSRKLQDKYSLSDLNFQGSRLSAVSMNSEYQKQPSILGYGKTDFINQKSPRIPQLPPKVNTFQGSLSSNPFPTSKKKLKTIEEEQGINTMTIEPGLNTIEEERNRMKRHDSPQNMSSIQKQKAKIRQAMSGKKKTSQEISISGNKYRDYESRASQNNRVDTQQNEGMKSIIEGKDKSFNISVDFQLSDQQDQSGSAQLDSKIFKQQAAGKGNGFSKNKQKHSLSQKEINQLKRQKQALQAQLLNIQKQLEQLET